MLRLVTTNNVDVFRHLASASFQRLEIDYRIGANFDETLAHVRQFKPAIVLVDIELAGGNGFDLCAQIKADESVPGTHVILLLSSVISRTMLRRIDQCGCDDVLALPIHNEEFYHHMAQLAGFPLRRNPRIAVSMAVLVPSSDELLEGAVLDVSRLGAGIAVPFALESDRELTVRLRHEGTTYPDSVCRVAWARKHRDEPLEYFAGIEFPDSTPVETRLLLEKLALFDILPGDQPSATERASEHITVALQGDITEMTDFTSLRERIEGARQIDFNCAAVRYLSSAGVANWCHFLEGVPATAEYRFRHCSVAFASQAAMVPLVLGRGTVVSLEAPYFCEQCDREELRLLESDLVVVDGAHVVPPSLTCRTCGGELDFDDLADRYFAFLRRDLD